MKRGTKRAEALSLARPMELLKHLGSIDDEAMLEQMLEEEKAKDRRVYVMRRLFGRLNALRTRRALLEIERG